MFQQEFSAAADAAAGKYRLLSRSPLSYLLLSMLAGAYIGFGVLLTNTIGASLQGSPFTKLILGLAFGVALSLVVMAGAELFTGNNLVMAAGVIKGKVTLLQALGLWTLCWLGNLLGAMLLAGVYDLSGLGQNGVGEYMAAAAAAKAGAGIVPLFCRGILCNILVCLAVWCGFRAKSDAGKLIMVFWCLFAFITTGFEHSVANMTLFSAVLFRPSLEGLTLAGALHNLLWVTLGNLVGGVVFVALPYASAAKAAEKR